MRPIGVGDTARYIVAKVVLTVIREDILDVAGLLQLCAGQMAGSEAAIRQSFEKEKNELVIHLILSTSKWL